MRTVMDSIYRYIAIASVFCGLIMADSFTSKAAPSEEVISNVARQIEDGKSELTIGYTMEAEENEYEVVHNVLKRVRNYSDAAAKLSFDMQDYCLNLYGTTLVSIEFEHATERGEQEALDREYDRMYEEIRSNIRNFDTISNRKKLNAVLGYMAENFSYGFKNGIEGRKYGLMESIKKSRKMTCTGYAEVIDELCERMGISCRIIVNEEHAWNCIMLTDEGVYIQVDGTMKYTPYVTYDDGYHRLDYGSPGKVEYASVFDNLFFWLQSYPVVLCVIFVASFFIVAKRFERGHISAKQYKRRTETPAQRKAHLSPIII